MVLSLGGGAAQCQGYFPIPYTFDTDRFPTDFVRSLGSHELASQCTAPNLRFSAPA